MTNDNNFTNPLVSIIIPVFNGANYLADAIDSALNQTYENLEVLVVNDGSNDDGATEKIAQSYGNRIRYFRKDNGGVSSALNFGIRNMRGTYFSWLSHDDLYCETKVADAIKLLKKGTDLTCDCIAYTGCVLIDRNGTRLKNYGMPFESDRLYSSDEVLAIMTASGTLNGCCMLIPRTAFDRVSFFHEGLRYSQDSLMWYLLFLSGYTLISDHKKNVMYRLHSGQTSQIRRDLFESDSLSIAKILAPMLSEKDKTGTLYYSYTKRLTKNRSTDAIRYLMQFSAEHQVLSASRQMKLKIAGMLGAVRYCTVSILKKCLIRIGKR